MHAHTQLLLASPASPSERVCPSAAAAPRRPTESFVWPSSEQRLLTRAGAGFSSSSPATLPLASSAPRASPHAAARRQAAQHSSQPPHRTAALVGAPPTAWATHSSPTPASLPASPSTALVPEAGVPSTTTTRSTHTAASPYAAAIYSAAAAAALGVAAAAAASRPPDATSARTSPRGRSPQSSQSPQSPPLDPPTSAWVGPRAETTTSSEHSPPALAWSGPRPGTTAAGMRRTSNAAGTVSSADPPRPPHSAAEMGRRRASEVSDADDDYSNSGPSGGAGDATAAGPPALLGGPDMVVDGGRNLLGVASAGHACEDEEAIASDKGNAPLPEVSGAVAAAPPGTGRTRKKQAREGGEWRSGRPGHTATARKHSSSSGRRAVGAGSSTRRSSQPRGTANGRSPARR